MSFLKGTARSDLALGDSGGKSSGKIALKLCRNGIHGNKYRISLYSFRGNYYFLNLEIVANLNSC